jgi:hypothetical protein
VMGAPSVGPPPIRQQTVMIVCMSWSGPSVAALPSIALGASRAIDSAAAVSRPAMEKEAMDAAMVNKATDDTAAAENASVDKKAADAATEKKDADELAAAERATADKRAAEVAVDYTAVGERATTEEGTQGTTESSPALMTGAKRTAMSGDSTPPAKQRFPSSWKPG